MTEVTRDLRDEAKAALLRWSEQNTPEQFEAAIHKSLNNRRDDTVAKLLGFERDGFGRGDNWRVDHCNGRSGNSTIGDKLRELIGESLDSWVRSVIADMPDFPDSIRQAAQEEYVSEFRKALRDEIRTAARDHAHEHAQKIAKEAVSFGLPFQEVKSLDEDDDFDPWNS